MEKTVNDIIETLLASVQEDVDDPELRYKLRAARQLNVLCKDQTEGYKQTLDEVDLDQNILEKLYQLGYLEYTDD